MARIKKYLHYGIYLFAFLLPFQVQLILRRGELAGSDWQYGTIGLYVTDIVLVGVLILFGFYYFKNKEWSREKRVRISIFWWLLSGLDVFAFISIFLAPDHVLAVYRYAVFLLALGAALVVIKVPVKRVKLVYFFALGMLFHALLGIGQFLGQYAPGFKYLGLAEHNPKKLGVSVVETIGMDGIPRRWLRAYGGLDHPNVLGGALVVAILLLVGFWAARRFYYKKDFAKWDEAARRKVKLQERRQAGNYALVLVMAVGLFFSFSRGGWLALVAGAAVLIIGYLISKRGAQAKRVGKILGLTLILVGILSFSYSSIVATRLSGETRLEKKSTHQRMESFREAKQLIRENPVFGVGIGNYTAALQEKYPDRRSWSYQPVHNTFLLVATEIGIIGMLFLVALLGYLLIESFRQRNILNLAILTSLVIMLMLDHWWWSLHFGMLFQGFVWGILFNNLEKSKIKNSKLKAQNLKLKITT